MASKKSRRQAAKAAAKRIPIAGTAVVVAPLIRAASQFNASNLFSMEQWKQFFNNLIVEYTGTDPSSGAVNGTAIARTYVPIGVYLLARRFAGRHISRVLRPLGIKF